MPTKYKIHDQFLLFRVACVFFFNDTATTEIYTLSLHDALPIWAGWPFLREAGRRAGGQAGAAPDRKSTRLNSSHITISYAVFCLKKKKPKTHDQPTSKTKRDNASKKQ